MVDHDNGSRGLGEKADDIRSGLGELDASEKRDEGSSLPSLVLWLIVGAAVLIVGLWIPVPGLDLDVVAAYSQPGGLLGQLNLAAPLFPILGGTLSTLLVVHVILLVSGRFHRPMTRRMGAAIYLLISGSQAFAIALYLESLNQESPLGYLVDDPGWGFRTRATFGMTAGAALLWWAADRIDRTGRAYGALYLSLLAMIFGSLEQAGADGQLIGSGQLTPMDALGTFDFVVALAIVGGVLLARPGAWPARLFGAVRLRSGWDALGLMSLGVVPFQAASSAMILLAPESDLRLVTRGGQLFTLGLAVGFAVFWIRRGASVDAVRSWLPGSIGVATMALSLFVVAVSAVSAGGIETMLAPGELEGTASYRLVLGAEDRFASGEGEAMVRRIEAGGARAVLESADERRITLRVEDAREPERIVEALQPHELSVHLVAEQENDPFTGEFRVNRSMQDAAIRSWEGGCDRIERIVDTETRDDCAYAIEARTDELDDTHPCVLYCLEREAVIDGDDIADASVAVDPYNQHPVVSLQLTEGAADSFERVTSRYVDHALAIVVDGQIVSAPVIQSAIPGGRVQITLGTIRDFDTATMEAHDLAISLRPDSSIHERFEVLTIDPL